ncbi:HAD family hydrolase [Streptosporangium longisporum]|uniref:Haloacid dehalogenase type II n=1 Tax=Streptosporangium longisporum TaxID=46187 RepID=A0ABP6KV68_9ACTN
MTSGSGTRRSYRALSFDGDGTLWDFDSAMRQALEDAARLLRDAGALRPGGPVTAGWLREVRDHVAGREEYRGRTMESIRLASFRRAVAECGISDAGLAREAYETYMRARWERLRTYQEVPGALATLGTRYRLALVTNGNTRPHRVGLDGVFDTVVVSAECGLYKPDPGIYLHAAARMGLGPAEVLHTGDDPVEDVDAARRAGMDTAWVNRHGAHRPSSDPSEVTVGDLAELTTLLLG